jgi:hypothetical protein
MMFKTSFIGPHTSWGIIVPVLVYLIHFGISPGIFVTPFYSLRIMFFLLVVRLGWLRHFNPNFVHEQIAFGIVAPLNPLTNSLQLLFNWKTNMEDQDVKGRIIMKWIGNRVQIGLIWLRTEPVAGCWEHLIEFLSSIQCRELLAQLSDCWLLRRTVRYGFIYLVK